MDDALGTAVRSSSDLHSHVHVCACTCIEFYFACTSRVIFFSCSLTSSILLQSLESQRGILWDRREIPCWGRTLPWAFSAALDLQDFIGVEEQQDLWMVVALKLEIRKVHVREVAMQDTGSRGRSGNRDDPNWANNDIGDHLLGSLPFASCNCNAGSSYSSG